ncbi:DUF805 domain-containing protein [Macrococcus carouselicus]|nr:DUF805 domain-containing protein [Macrococcus carouselicus]
MTFMEAYKRFWKKAFVMKGRARRKEYWAPVLFNVLIAFAIAIVFSFVDSAMGYKSDVFTADPAAVPDLMKPSDIASYIWSLIILIPSFTVLARRLQDININGWWALVSHLGGTIIALGIIIALVFSLASGDFGTLGMILILGLLALALIWIIFFVFTVLDGNPRPNKYGDDPKRDERYYYHDTY